MNEVVNIATTRDTVASLRATIAERDKEIERLRSLVRCYLCGGREARRGEKFLVCEAHLHARIPEAMQPFAPPEGYDRGSAGIAPTPALPLRLRSMAVAPQAPLVALEVGTKGDTLVDSLYFDKHGHA